MLKSGFWSAQVIPGACRKSGHGVETETSRKSMLSLPLVRIWWAQKSIQVVPDLTPLATTRSPSLIQVRISSAFHASNEKYGGIWPPVTAQSMKPTLGTLKNRAGFVCFTVPTAMATSATSTAPCLSTPMCCDQADVLSRCGTT